MDRALRRFIREHRVLDRAGSAVVRMARPILGRRFDLAGSISPAPFFIVGSGRSGNTLVRRILNESPELHIPPETFVLGPVIELFERNSYQAWAVLLRLVLSTFEYHPGFEDFGVGLRPLYQRLRDSPRSHRTLSHIVDALYRFHGETVGADFRRWGDKTPLNTYFLERIHRLFPDAQFVHVIRDGIDVAHSYVRSGLMANIEESSTRWLTSVQAVERFSRRHPGQVIEVRYEALVANPAETARLLCTFLDVNFDDSMLRIPNQELGDVERHAHHARTLQPIRRNRVGMGRQSLTDEDIKRLSPAFLHQLEQAGYSPPGREHVE